MSTAELSGELRPLLEAEVGSLNIGNWRAVLRPQSGGRSIAGVKHLVRWATALELVARSMQLQAQGRLQDAWDELSEAVKFLPSELTRLDVPTNTMFAVLRPEPSDTAWPDVKLAEAIARLIWREQFELLDLQRTFLPGRMAPREELVAAWHHYQAWVEFDPTTFDRAPGRPTWNDGVVIDRSRTALCRRGTAIRQFADPTSGVQLSQSPWQDVGAYRGLCSLALTQLAGQSAPAPWCGMPHTSGLIVRRGRLRVWQYALQWRKDRDLF